MYCGCFRVSVSSVISNRVETLFMWVMSGRDHGAPHYAAHRLCKFSPKQAGRDWPGWSKTNKGTKHFDCPYVSLLGCNRVKFVLQDFSSIHLARKFLEHDGSLPCS